MAKKTASEIIEIAIASAKAIHPCVVNALEDIQWAHDYAEPGYYLGEGKVVLMGNWNTPTPWGREDVSDDLKKRIAKFWGRVKDALEKVAELEWHDEWTTCGDCGKAVRTQADSYSWTASFTIFNECELVCHECAEPEHVFRSYEGDYSRASTLDADPEDHGYVKVNEENYESGWYPGQTDNPKEIAERLEMAGISRYFFQIASVGQFDAHFDCYVHESEAKLLDDLKAA